MPESVSEIAAAARHIVRGAATAALATTMTPVPGGRPGDKVAGTGGPYASLVLLAVDPAGAPVLLISALAEHTRNVNADPRVSILCDGTAGRDSPLTGPRVTLQGRLAPTADPRHRARFLARHPDAAEYADFSDFAFFRLEVSSAHLVEGFGRIHWLGGVDFLFDVAGATEMIAAETEIVAHVNRDHAEAPSVLAQSLGHAPGGWILTGCDPEGCDLRRGGSFARYRFPAAARTPAEVRAWLVAALEAARTTA